MSVLILSFAGLSRNGTLVRRDLLPLVLFLFGLAPTFAGPAAQQNVPTKPVPANPAPANPNEQDQGWFLIARRELSDPFFAKSTVLMLPGQPYPLVVGLIINKPTKMKLEELFPHAKSVKKQDVTAYFGGPVDIRDVSAIFRATIVPKDAVDTVHIFADVYLTFDAKSVEDLVKKSKQPSELRIFLGRSQWTQPQLEHEMAIGSWYSTRESADPIFSSDPGKVWEALVDRIAPRPYVDYHRPQARTATALSRSTL